MPVLATIFLKTQRVQGKRMSIGGARFCSAVPRWGEDLYGIGVVWGGKDLLAMLKMCGRLLGIAFSAKSG